jgi:hypothetical protein
MNLNIVAIHGIIRTLLNKLTIVSVVVLICHLLSSIVNMYKNKRKTKRDLREL